MITVQFGGLSPHFQVAICSIHGHAPAWHNATTRKVGCDKCPPTKVGTTAPTRPRRVGFTAEGTSAMFRDHRPADDLARSLGSVPCTCTAAGVPDKASFADDNTPDGHAASCGNPQPTGTTWRPAPIDRLASLHRSPQH